jgi:transposase
VTGDQKMLQLAFTEEEIQELDYERYHYPHPRVQRKMEAVLLKAKGLPHHQIAHCVGVCENTMLSYLREYQEGGIEALKRLEFYQPKSDLEEHRDTLEAYFQEHPPTTIPHAAAMIEERDLHQAQSDTGRHFSQKARSQATQDVCSSSENGCRKARRV